MNTTAEQAAELAASGDAICLNGFRDAACGEESERIELLQMYAEQLTKKIPQVEAACAANQLGEVARVVHSLCGATFTCGLSEFGAVLRALEQAAKNNDAAAVSSALAKALALAMRVSQAVAVELRRCRG